MLVVLIEEPRFAEVNLAMRNSMLKSAQDGRQAYGWPEGMTESQRMMIAEDLCRAMNFTFVRWAQSHGASCVPK